MQYGIGAGSICGKLRDFLRDATLSGKLDGLESP